MNKFIEISLYTFSFHILCYVLWLFVIVPAEGQTQITELGSLIYLPHAGRVLPVIFLTQFWIFASLIISTKHVLGLKSNLKSFGIIFLAFLLIAFLSVSFVISRMNALPISTIS